MSCAAHRDKADGTTPMLPTRLIEGRDAVLELGGLKLELRQRGAAHTPGHASRTYLEMERE